jgi:hypothetical protein
MKINIAKMIEKWAEVFNMPVNKKICYPSKNSVNMVIEETRELSDALTNMNLSELRDIRIDELLEENEFVVNQVVDGAVDTIWVCIRLLQDMGVDTDKALQSVYNSNMSKVFRFTDIKEVQEEVNRLYDKYNSKFFIKVVPTDNNGVIFKNENTGKVLKPTTFKEPDFSWIKLNY